MSNLRAYQVQTSKFPMALELFRALEQLQLVEAHLIECLWQLFHCGVDHHANQIEALDMALQEYFIFIDCSSVYLEKQVYVNI